MRQQADTRAVQWPHCDRFNRETSHAAFNQLQEWPLCVLAIDLFIALFQSTMATPTKTATLVNVQITCCGECAHNAHSLVQGPC